MNNKNWDLFMNKLFLRKKLKYSCNSMLAMMLFASIISSCTSKVHPVTQATTPSSSSTPTSSPTDNTYTTIPSNSNNSNGSNAVVAITPTPSTNSGLAHNIVYGDATGSSAKTCDAYGIDTATSSWNYDYHRIPVVANGNLSGGVMWSTANNLQAEVFGADQEYLRTDSTLQVRVVAKPGPRGCDLINTPPSSVTNLGVRYWISYGELEVTVGVRLRDSNSNSYNSIIKFSGVKTNECSPPRYFQSIPRSGGALALDILNVKSNYECVNKYGIGIGGTSPYCPYAYLQWLGCWEIELQIATDDTKRIPE
ncbi:MAG: hypothetical protein HQK50_09880 [Oligoflexia bacterium]|nr:hypothetical protein [Oligoflexia bacterium]MBF0365870.1 hypothetical protein [Oligoflexia bacterium]